MIGLYLADLAAPQGKAPALSVATIERPLSGLGWNYAQTVLAAGICSELPEKDRLILFTRHSLRASSAVVDARYFQKRAPPGSVPR